MKSYARFWTAFNKLDRGGVEREALKEQLVRSFTEGRTVSLREMSDGEYEALCKSLEERNGYRDELRFRRSCCLNRMYVLGVDTHDWSRVNAFCMDRRIAGKRFAQLQPEELKELDVKLRAIERKGGLKTFEVNNSINNQQSIRDYGKTEENCYQWSVKGDC